MGGIGSGNYCRWGSRTTVEEVQRIDIRYMRRQKLLRPGGWGTLSWSCRGEPTGNIRYQCFPNELVLSYRIFRNDDWENVEQRIVLEHTPCNYGNARAWLHCPRCNRRCEILCLGRNLFLCRKCYRLPYQSQQEGKLDRLMTKQRKLEERLWGDKRRRMKKTTFDRLCTEFEKVSALADEGIFRRMGQYL